MVGAIVVAVLATRGCRGESGSSERDYSTPTGTVEQETGCRACLSTSYVREVDGQMDEGEVDPQVAASIYRVFHVGSWSRVRACCFAP